MPAPRRVIPGQFAPSAPTQRDGIIVAVDKVSSAPLQTLTPAMVESIAASHVKRGTPAFERLVERLGAVVARRKANA
jgi:hypothetical protein